MNTPTKWSPLKELEELQHRMTGWLGRAPWRSETGGREALTVAEWAPAVDISEDEKEYLIKAELPDIPREAVKVNVENGVLAIQGERRFEKEEKDKRYHRIERSYGSFLRSFEVPENVDPAKVSAEFKDGILRVHLPKSEQSRPKAVEVKVG